ncbi:GH39 family glycosyl hydrolase [Telluribacter sp.]|jgi:hypothetical protein|uniref:GH39 family glycosyl hydrolase n=1 Tax=Telluribacter sp. TaxID=1978767 RepID=UPI002E126740|nr:hypothetical protein [Telluribacter sp.]
MFSLKRSLVLVVCICVSISGRGQFIDTTADRVKTPLTISYKKLGTLTPRSSQEIKASRITVGCETLDRDHTVWANYKAYLPPLGVKKIRLQAGWAKCEKVKGVYDWKWLDEIIDYAVAHKLEPWLETSYGNPIYEGGGGTNLLNSLMTSPEAYAAWDRWVEALAIRYKDRVKEWEIWNEPDHPGQKITPETTAELNIRTASIIRRIQPEANIAGLAFASNSDTAYLNRFLKVIADQKKLDLFNWISYHSYTMPPEAAYTEKRVLGLRNVLQKYSKEIQLRQGENGAPSTYIPSFALDKYYWTEYTQAKYDMRRLLGDLGHDIETSVFTIIDIYYNWGDRAVLNTKGLIQSDITMAAIRPKVAYYAVQNLASVFDNTLELDPDSRLTADTGESVSLYGYQNRSSKKNLISLWLDGKNPTNDFRTTPVTVKADNMSFTAPVYVDLMTGHIYEIPKSDWTKTGNSILFKNIPLYDSPVLIVEKALVIKQ